MLNDPEFHKKLSRINADYFAFPERVFALKRGETLAHEGEASRRLYLLLRGSVIAYRTRLNDKGEKIPNDFYEVFRAGPGSYIGVQSFFSKRFKISCEIVAETDIEVAYIDETVEVVEPEKYGSLIEQFVPTMVHELALRNSRVFEQAAKKEAALLRMHRAEMSATLGQLAAGLAHELNNAVGVLARKTDFLSEFIEDYLSKDKKGTPAEMFRIGRDNRQVYSSEDVRSRSREFERTFKISQSAAKVLARIVPDEESAKKLDKAILKNIEDLAVFWQIGRDIRDMQSASKHAAGIVRSVRILGGGNICREEETDVRESISEAIVLLKPQLRNMNLVVEMGDAETFPKIYGDMTELAQLWVNIVKNACDAMSLAETPNPTVKISLTHTESEISVAITDNGPGVPDSLKEKIFQPDFSTKKNGLSFGLGLGLAIVRRIVDDYRGNIELDSRPASTTFKITLPINKSE